jgi:NTP pyrophosphatase (non-canonical NTP hydrolase)
MIKQFSSYQRLASKTASYKDPDYLPLGLVEECGELVHEFARCKRKNVPMDVEALSSEIGDVLWILSQMCRENDLSLADVATKNIAKLKKRDSEGSIHSKENRGTEAPVEQSSRKISPRWVTRITAVSSTVAGICVALLISYFVVSKELKTTPDTSSLDCAVLKEIYEEAYIEALHPITDVIDWDALDKEFYTKYKECT